MLLILRSTRVSTRRLLLNKNYVHEQHKPKVDRRLILDFLNIDTFDEKEIERSYKKYVLNDSKGVDSVKIDTNIASDSTIKTFDFIHKTSGTRESLKANVINKLDKLRGKPIEKYLNQHHDNKPIDIISDSSTHGNNKYIYITADDVMSLFPLISAVIPPSSSAIKPSSLSSSSNTTRAISDTSDVVINAAISDVNFDNSKRNGEVINVVDANQKVFSASSSSPSSPSLTAIDKQLPAADLFSSSQVHNAQSLDYNTYRQHIRTFGEKLDDRVWTVAGSFLLTGASIGMIIPCMPILVKQLELTSSDFGLVVSCFGLAKLMANIPAGYYVDVLGRKPMLVMGLGMCAVGIGGLGMALSPWVLPLPTLMACRFITGLGVSTFSAGAFMMMNDVSTPLNRTRTMAPVMTGFQAGIALGPAIGGVAIQTLGIPLTYMSCGVLFSFIAAVNHALLQETLRNKSGMNNSNIDDGEGDNSNNASNNTDGTGDKAIHSTTVQNPMNTVKNGNHGVFTSFSTAISRWYQLSVNNHPLRQLCLVNLMYWFTLAGVQMTLLPLYMVSPMFNLAPTQIGSAFALMSIFSILSSQPTAYLADGVFGKTSSILIGCALVTTSFLALPFATTYYELLMVLVPLSIGSTVLQSVPTAYVADITPPTDRSQALSLFRTAGDVGLLVGASTTGWIMSFVTSSSSSVSAMSDGFHTAIHMNAGLMMTAMAYFAFRLYQQKWRNKQH